MGNACASAPEEKKDEIKVSTTEVEPQSAVSEDPAAATPPAPAAEPVEEKPAAAPETIAEEKPAAAPEPAPAAALAATAGGKIWEIKFEKTGPLGIGMKDEKGTVKIGSVGKDGLIAKYNAAHKDSMALPGDAITSVNGTAASTLESITSAIKSASGQMSLGLSRPDDGSKFFTVSVEKTGPLGIGLAEKTMDKITFSVISTVKPEGLIKTFNDANPGSAVEQGDTIIAVNGTFGTAADTKTALTSATGTVEMVLKRAGGK